MVAEATFSGEENVGDGENLIDVGDVGVEVSGFEGVFPAAGEVSSCETTPR